MKKPKNSLLNDIAWNRLNWWQQLDHKVSRWIPNWIVCAVVAVVFGSLVWAPFSLATVFVMWDWDAWFGMWNRLWLAFWVLLFFWVLIKD